MTSAISSSSLAAQLAQSLFKRTDANNDGLLTEAEIDATRPKDSPSGAPKTADLIKSMDADGDGKLTQAELEKGLKALQSKVADAAQTVLLAIQEQAVAPNSGSAGSVQPGINVLTADDEARLGLTMPTSKPMQPTNAVAAQSEPSSSPTRSVARPVTANEFIEALFKTMDANQDGKLTEAEIEAGNSKRGDSAGPTGAALIKAGDNDGDGKLTQAELEKAMKATGPAGGGDVASMIANANSLVDSMNHSLAQSIGSLLESLLKALDDDKVEQSEIDDLKKKAQAAVNSAGVNFVDGAKMPVDLSSLSYASKATSLAELLKYQEPS